MPKLRALGGAVLCWILCFPCVGFSAEVIHVGYVTGVEPAKAGIGDGSFERSAGQKIEWRRFDNGAEVVRALAAGDLDIANLGSSEPFGALDALTREQMQTLLLKVWRRTGKQIVLVTHDIEEAVFLASDLVMLSARPARVASRLALDFGQRYAAGEPARRIKSDPAFIDQREQVLSWLFEQGERGDG